LKEEGGGGVGQNHIIVLLRYFLEQMCKLILVYLEIHLRNVYHYSVLKGGDGYDIEKSQDRK
jgi:hypothetical protein